MGDASTHHTGVGLDRYHLRHANAGENAPIGLIAFFIIALQVLLRGVEGVGILHREFPHADQPATAARLVAEFRLDLIDHEGIIGVGFCRAACELHGRLLMRHTEDNVAPAAILKAGHLAADALITAGFLPEGGGHDHGEQHFLPADRIHLLADNLLDLAGDPARRRIERIDTVA